MSRAVFLDRDGTLNTRPPEHDYVRSPGDFVWLPGAREAIARLSHAGYIPLVVSNQRGVAQGLVEQSTLRAIEAQMQTDLQELGVAIRAFSYCVHDDGDACDCRKPKPGLLTTLASELGVDLSQSWMIGDSESDVLAGQRAGCRTALIGTHATLTNPDFVAASLAEVGKRLVSLDFTVVVCAHDEARWTDLQAAVGSLERQSLRPAEVVVVVDHNPRLLIMARERFADAIVVENTGHPGLGEARNTGVECSSASVVAFLDDDAVASEHWLASLAERYADADVAGVGGSIRARWVSGRPRWFPPEFDWVVGCSYRGMPESVSDVRNLLGCNMSFRREVVEELGRFQLGYGCDETEFCIRLHQRWPSRRLTYVPFASVSHRVPDERGRVGYFARRCWFEGGSKAVVSKLVGAGDGLSTEVSYARRVLPQGARRGVGDFVLRGDSGGIARAGAIVLGLTATAAGYLWGHLTARRAARRRGWAGKRLARRQRTLTSLTRL